MLFLLIVLIVGVALSLIVIHLGSKQKETEWYYTIYLRNETHKNIRIKDNLTIEPNQSVVLNLDDTNDLSLDNGVVFRLSENEDLETIDPKNQVSGIGEEYDEKYGIPKDVTWAFVILNENEGDTIN